MKSPRFIAAAESRAISAIASAESSSSYLGDSPFFGFLQVACGERLGDLMRAVFFAAPVEHLLEEGNQLQVAPGAGCGDGLGFAVGPAKRFDGLVVGDHDRPSDSRGGGCVRW